MEAHVAFIAAAEIVDNVFWPLIGLGQQYFAGKKRVHLFS